MLHLSSVNGSSELVGAPEPGFRVLGSGWDVAISLTFCLNSSFALRVLKLKIFRLYHFLDSLLGSTCLLENTRGVTDH